MLLSALALAAGVNTVAAQVAPGQLTITPGSGPPGTTITVKGTGCSRQLSSVSSSR